MALTNNLKAKDPLGPGWMDVSICNILIFLLMAKKNKSILKGEKTLPQTNIFFPNS